MNIATTAAPPEYREGPRKYARRRKSPWEQWFKDKRAGMGCQGKGQRLWLSLTSAFPQRLKPRPFKTNQTEPLRRRRLNDLESDWFGGAGGGSPPRLPASRRRYGLGRYGWRRSDHLALLSLVLVSGWSRCVPPPPYLRTPYFNQDYFNSTV